MDSTLPALTLFERTEFWLAKLVRRVFVDSDINAQAGEASNLLPKGEPPFDAFVDEAVRCGVPFSFRVLGNEITTDRSVLLENTHYFFREFLTPTARAILAMEDLKSEPAEVGADAEVEAKIDAEVEAKIDAEVEAKIDAEVEAKIDAEVEAKIDAEIKADSDNGLGIYGVSWESAELMAMQAASPTFGEEFATISRFDEQLSGIEAFLVARAGENRELHDSVAHAIRRVRDLLDQVGKPAIRTREATAYIATGVVEAFRLLGIPETHPKKPMYVVIGRLQELAGLPPMTGKSTDLQRYQRVRNALEAEKPAASAIDPVQETLETGADL